MKPTIWKRVALIEALCIAVLLTFGVWRITQVRRQARIETLHALYDHLAPDPEPETQAPHVPLVLDIIYKNNELRYKLNGEQMSGEKLGDIIRQSVDIDDPVIMRPTNNTPFVEIVSTLRFVTEKSHKIFLLHSDKEVFAITNRNITQLNNLPDIEWGLFPDVYKNEGSSPR